MLHCMKAEKDSDHRSMDTKQVEKSDEQDYNYLKVLLVYDEQNVIALSILFIENTKCSLDNVSDVVVKLVFSC